MTARRSMRGEDVEFRNAVEATGRHKLLIAALWTEACLTFPALDALRAGYEVFPIVDAVGGTSPTAHETALRRVEQAGAQLTSIPQLLCELQRDWARTSTVSAFTDLLFNKHKTQPQLQEPSVAAPGHWDLAPDHSAPDGSTSGSPVRSALSNWRPCM